MGRASPSSTEAERELCEEKYAMVGGPSFLDKEPVMSEEKRPMAALSVKPAGSSL